MVNPTRSALEAALPTVSDRALRAEIIKALRPTATATQWVRGLRAAGLL